MYDFQMNQVLEQEMSHSGKLLHSGSMEGKTYIAEKIFKPMGSKMSTLFQGINR